MLKKINNQEIKIKERVVQKNQCLLNWKRNFNNQFNNYIKSLFKKNKRQIIYS